jgi:hypothetical protein
MPNENILKNFRLTGLPPSLMLWLAKQGAEHPGFRDVFIERFFLIFNTTYRHSINLAKVGSADISAHVAHTSPP